jgi:hypothetical protein
MIAQLASSSDFAMSSAPVRAGDVNLFARYSDRVRHLRALRTGRARRVCGPPRTSGGRAAPALDLKAFRLMAGHRAYRQ